MGASANPTRFPAANLLSLSDPAGVKQSTRSRVHIGDGPPCGKQLDPGYGYFHVWKGSLLAGILHLDLRPTELRHLAALDFQQLIFAAPVVDGIHSLFLNIRGRQGEIELVFSRQYVLKNVACQLAISRIFKDHFTH